MVENENKYCQVGREVRDGVGLGVCHDYHNLISFLSVFQN